jgi:hypothetical protein
MVVAAVLALMLSTAASGYSFGDWAIANGYSLNADMPDEVDAGGSSPAIDSLNGIGDYNWTATPTTNLYLYNNQLSSIESGDFSGLSNLTTLDLWGNQISSIESGDFSELTSLTSLQLAINQISSIESGAFSGLANLEMLYLGNNQL